MRLRHLQMLGSAFGLGLAPLLIVGCRAPSDARQQAATSPASAANSERAPAMASSKTTSAATASFLQPVLDLPANRLHEHVDGAEPWLQAIGCRRLLFWKLENPAAELEILVFSSEAGAKQVLDKDSGGDRSQALPGDEGWTNGQVLYFRRGAFYGRLIADVPAPVLGLAEHAKRADRAIIAGKWAP